MSSFIMLRAAQNVTGAWYHAPELTSVKLTLLYPTAYCEKWER
jgi:hypothetical protein